MRGKTEYEVLSRIWHSGHGKEYEAGAVVELNHLDAEAVLRLIQAGPIRLASGERPRLELEQVAGLSGDVALLLLGVDVKTLTALAEAESEALAAWIGVGPGAVKGWQTKARRLLDKAEKREVRDGASSTDSTDGE